MIRDDQYYFLSYLLSRSALSLKDVTVICLSLFSDGLSTTTPTLMFNLHCLAAWPEVQQRVFEEVQEYFPKQGEPVTPNSLSNMQYLKAFVKETFRYSLNKYFQDKTVKSKIVAKRHGGIKVLRGGSGLVRIPHSIWNPS